MGLMPVAVTGANLAFPAIESSFAEASRSTLSWSLSGYSIVIAAFTLLGGQLTDRLDSGRMFKIGLVVFGLGSLLAGAAPEPLTLIAGRCVQGIGGALVVPASLVVATSRYPVERHPFVIGVWTASFPLGSSFAPSITAVILQLASWRWMFFATCLLAAAAWVAFKVAVDGVAPTPPGASESGPTGASNMPDFFGVILGTTAVGLLSLGIVQGPRWGWTSFSVVGVLTLALALFPVFVWRSRRHPRPLINLDLFKIRTFSVATIVNVFISVAGTAVWLIWPLFLINEWDYSQIEVGLAITPTPVIAGFGSLAIVKLTERIGFRLVLTVGLIALALGNLWFLVMLEGEPNYVGRFLPGIIFFGIGMACTFAPVNAAAMVDLDVAEYGQGNAGFNTIRSLASALGIAGAIAALGDSDADIVAGVDRAFLLLLIVVVAGLAAMVAAWPKTAARQ